MTKIGSDVISRKETGATKIQLNSFELRNQRFRGKILDALRNSDRPLNITEVSRTTGITYLTTRSILMELLLDDKVTRYKSGMSVYYRIK